MPNEEKLVKIVQLAKYGVGGEKKNAEMIVVRLCYKYNLDFEAVMSDTENTYEYVFYYKSLEESKVVVQVLWRYVVSDKHPGVSSNKSRKALFAECTKAQYVEALYLIEVYLKAYRKAKKEVADSLLTAFCSKHDLYSSSNPNLTSKPSDYENDPIEMDKARRALALAHMMDDVIIRKSIHG